MNRGPKAEVIGGFTIIEVLIVLAVTIFLFFVAALTISGKQDTTEFNQASNELQSYLQQIIDSVQNGSYTNNENFICNAGISAPPTIVPGSGVTIGSNTGCIFLGKDVQFAVTDNASSTYKSQLIYTYPIVGNRLSSSNLPSQNLLDANPVILAVGDTPKSEENASLEYGLEFACQHAIMYYTAIPSAGTSPCRSPGAGIYIGAFGFATNTPDSTSSGPSGDSDASQAVSLVAFDNTNLGDTPQLNISNVNHDFGIYESSGGTSDVIVSPAGGILMCLKSGGTNESALLSVGESNQALSISINVIENSKTC